MHASGWRSHSPATPNRDDIRREPTDEALIQFWMTWVSLLDEPAEYNAKCYLRAALAHFNAPLSEPGQAEIADDVIEAGDRVRSRSGRFSGMVVKVISVSHGLVYFEAGAEVYSALEEDFTIYDKASWTAEPSTHNSIDRKGLEQENPAPAKPQTTISAAARIEPTETAIHNLWMLGGARLVTFQGDGQQYEISAYKARLLTKKIIELFGGEVKSEITEEEIEALANVHSNYSDEAGGWRFSKARLFDFAHTLLAKQSGASTLSDKTLRELWHLAHQNALDQFVTDAKGMVGR